MSILKFLKHLFGTDPMAWQHWSTFGAASVCPLCGKSVEPAPIATPLVGADFSEQIAGYRAALQRPRIFTCKHCGSRFEFRAVPPEPRDTDSLMPPPTKLEWRPGRQTLSGREEKQRRKLYNAIKENTSIQQIVALIKDVESIARMDASLSDSLLCTAMRVKPLPNATVIRTLLDHGADPDQADYCGQTPLHLACADTGREEIVRLLLSYGAEVNTIDSNGRTPISEATWEYWPDKSSNQSTVIEDLIKHGAQLDPEDDFLIKRAIWAGQVAVLKRLIESGRDVNSTVIEGDSERSLLAVAANRPNNEATIDFLLSCGATPTFDAMPFAAEHEYVGLLNRLISQGPCKEDIEAAMVDACGSGKTESIRLLLGAGANANGRDNAHDTTLLDMACRNGNPTCVRLLLEAGADPLERLDDRGLTALHHMWLGEFSRPEDDAVEIAELLIAAGADVNAKDDDGTDVLTTGAWGGKNSQLVACLLRHGAVADKVDDRYLVKIVENGHAEVVKQVIVKGVDVNMEVKDNSWDRTHHSLLHQASKTSGLEMVKTLVDGGAYVDARDTGTQQTPLHWAARSVNDDSGVVAFLLSHAAELDTACNNGWTPLHYAAAFDNLRCVRVLIEAGANTKARTNDGDTPIKLAKSRGHDSVVELLRHRQ